MLLLVSCGTRHQNGSETVCEENADSTVRPIETKQQKIDMSSHEARVYERTRSNLLRLEEEFDRISAATIEEVEELISKVSSLKFENDTTGMTQNGKESCEELANRITELKQKAMASATQRMQSIRIPVEANDDCLLEKKTAYPVYLERGDVLYYSIELQKPGSIKVFNADSRTLLRTYAQRTKITDSLSITNKGVYLVEVDPVGTQYASIDISYRMTGNTHEFREVKSEEIACKANDFRAVSSRGVSMRSAFDQPRKFTLSSQWKSVFNTAAKAIALIAVQIPAGATDLLYNLRISTSEQDNVTDGKFPENMNNTYKSIRFLGLPLYESNNSNGLYISLLGDNKPVREEDAYCNMYVFRNQSLAKQFQDGSKKASELQYDVDYSTLGTQSCNGRIPTKGAKTIYLAFENERVRYTNYIWVEVLTATPITEYHTTKYSVE